MLMAMCNKQMCGLYICNVISLSLSLTLTMSVYIICIEQSPWTEAQRVYVRSAPIYLNAFVVVTFCFFGCLLITKSPYNECISYIILLLHSYHKNTILIFILRIYTTCVFDDNVCAITYHPLFYGLYKCSHMTMIFVGKMMQWWCILNLIIFAWLLLLYLFSSGWLMMRPFLSLLAIAVIASCFLLYSINVYCARMHSLIPNYWLQHHSIWL